MKEYKWETEIIIPNCEEMTPEQLKQLLDVLDSLPINYQVWDKQVRSLK